MYLKGIIVLTIMKNISDFDIQALIDNELDWEEEKRVKLAINRDAQFIERYESLKNQKKLLQDWWKHRVQ